MSDCPCGSGTLYQNCCEPAHTGIEPSKTAEALMRSRYSAYAKHCVSYLGDTLHPDYRQDWSEEDTKTWAENSEWVSLEILNKDKGQEKDSTGVVEFAANFKEKGILKRHHELSNFVKQDDKWYYVDGATPKPVTIRNKSPKVGRNEKCPCGSGLKYKKCCG